MENLPYFISVVFVGGGFFALTSYRLNQFEKRIDKQETFNERIESKVDKISGYIQRSTKGTFHV